MLGCVSCNSLFKFHHLFSLLGYKSFLFFGSAIKKNIKLIFYMGNTTYVIGVHFSKESKDTLEDKMKRLMRDDVKAANF